MADPAIGTRSTIERERKYHVRAEDIAGVRATLERDGRWIGGGADADVYYDHDALKLRERDEYLRLRFRETTGERELTFKGAPRFIGEDKLRTEAIVALGPGAAEGLLTLLGFREVQRAVKLREVYELHDVEVSLDHLDPLGWFCEIEALRPQADLDVAAARLGLSPADQQRASYADLVEGLSR